MVAKDLKFGEEGRQLLLAGVNELTNAVQITMGPSGRNVVIHNYRGSPTITKDGVTVAKEIEFKDPVKNMGAQMVKDVASQTSDEAGDGTTTATVLARQILIEGLKAVVAGFNPLDLKRGIDKAVTVAVKALQQLSVPCNNTKAIAQVGTISANADETIGQNIANAMERIGKDGVITVEEGTGLEDELTVVDGMQFDRGYLSSYFITNQQTMSVELENPYILIADKKITIIKDLIPILGATQKTGRTLLIIAEDVEGEALASLVVNTIKGIVKTCVVKAPGFGDNRKEILQDIAVLTKTFVISDETGSTLDSVDIKNLGSAKRVVITKDTTIIIDGNGTKEILTERIQQLRMRLENSNSEQEKKKLQERVAKLAGGVAVLKVGAGSELEMKEKKARVEDALHATRAAVEEGVVPGGGVALIRALQAIKGTVGLNEAQNVGIQLTIKALEAPLRQIALNAGYEASVVLNKVLEKSGNYGFNAANGIYGDMLKMGILDPTKVTRTALQRAASVASMILTTECMITDLPGESNDP